MAAELEADHTSFDNVDSFFTCIDLDQSEHEPSIAAKAPEKSPDPTRIYQCFTETNFDRRVSTCWRWIWLLLYSALPSIAPGHELAEAGDLMVGNAGEHVGEPALRVDAVEFGGFDQGVGNGRGLAGAFEAHEQIFPPARATDRMERSDCCCPAPGYRGRDRGSGQKS